MVLALDDTALREPGDVDHALARHVPEDVVRLRLWRDGRERTLRLSLGEEIPDSIRSVPMPSASPGAAPGTPGREAKTPSEAQDLLGRRPGRLDVRVDRQIGVQRGLVVEDDVGTSGGAHDLALRPGPGDLEGLDPAPVTPPGTTNVTVTTAMTADPLTVWIDTELREVARLMDEHTIGAVPVLHGERVMGILTRGASSVLS